MNPCLCHHCEVDDCSNTPNADSVFKVTKTFLMKENADACAWEIRNKLGYTEVTVEEHSI